MRDINVVRLRISAFYVRSFLNDYCAIVPSVAGQTLRPESARVYAQANDKKQCASPRTDVGPDGLTESIQIWRERKIEQIKTAPRWSAACIKYLN